MLSAGYVNYSVKLTKNRGFFIHTFLVNYLRKGANEVKMLVSKDLILSTHPHIVGNLIGSGWGYINWALWRSELFSGWNLKLTTLLRCLEFTGLAKFNAVHCFILRASLIWKEKWFYFHHKFYGYFFPYYTKIGSKMINRVLVRLCLCYRPKLIDFGTS